MHKKTAIFCPDKPPTRRQLIAASEYAKNPRFIAELSRKFAFIREEAAKAKKATKKKAGGGRGR